MNEISSQWVELSSGDGIGATFIDLAETFGDFFKAFGDLAGVAAKYM
ncbi:hypothetical protein [Corynebacterium sp. LK2510]